MRVVLVAAGVYNIAFGIWAVAWPNLWFDWSGMERSRYPELWQSVGMIVGVYGIGYLIAASNPIRHWPIIFVGFLGKVFGPIGFVKAVYTGALPLSSAWITITNDLIWLVPFAMILWQTMQAKIGKPITRESLHSSKKPRTLTNFPRAKPSPRLPKTRPSLSFFSGTSAAPSPAKFYAASKT